MSKDLHKYNEKGAPPIGIVLTMPKKFFDSTGRDGQYLIREMLGVFSREDGLWNHHLSNLPTKDVAYVYFCWDGKVQLRGQLICYERGVSKTFFAPNGNQKTWPETNWVQICGPGVKAPYDIPCKGFQGFRYVTKEVF